MLHKIISGSTPIAAEHLFALASLQTRTANEYKFKKLTAHTTVCQQSSSFPVLYGIGTNANMRTPTPMRDTLY